jgi:choline dehydrogenase-like flavoprotein
MLKKVRKNFFSLELEATSENPKHKVLLIESGGEESVESDMPALFQLQFTDNRIDGFNNKTVPQTSFLNRKLRIIQGKWLGGSSVINGID